MIISHKHRYLFVEIPHTGSTAIKKELLEHYDGQSILKKHSFYTDFLKIATLEEKTYFVFAGIRNPLDEVISKYYKLKTNHREVFTDPKKLKKNGTARKRRDMQMFTDVYKSNLDFQTFFLKYYNRPYNNFASLIRDHYDYLIRFENLQEDFARMLRLLGIEPKRSLPVRNVTKERSRDFYSYYSPAMIPRAKRVFGPFMKQWGYTFPPEWGEVSLTWWDTFEFDLYSFLRRYKWNHLRFIP